MGDKFLLTLWSSVLLLICILGATSLTLMTWWMHSLWWSIYAGVGVGLVIGIGILRSIFCYK